MTRPFTIIELSREAGLRLLAEHHLGRIAFAFRDRVDIEPISYVYANGWIWARTSPGTKLTTVAHHPYVAFEVDEVQGADDWRSVVIHGTIYFIDPNTAFSLNISIEAALVAIVGGIGTLWGPVVGTVLLETTSTLLQSWLGSSTGGIQLTVYSLILMAVILWRPTGLMGLFNEMWQRYLDRKPARMRTSP